jgi:threonine dehydrogenase-like Zn-dependent dehydrogenase
MRALVLRKPGQADLETVADPVLTDTNVMLKVRFVGFCGSDLNSFRGLGQLRNQVIRSKRIRYPRLQKRTTGGFRGRHRASGSADVSR